MKPTISMIAAHDNKLGIGFRNDLPWHLPKDLQHFKKITLGNPVIMGRHTFDSIISRLKKPLPGRLSIVITSKEMPTYENVFSVKSLDEAIQCAEQEHFDEVFIIGGAQLYTSALSRAKKLYITRIDGEFECDTFFPEYEHEFEQISKNNDEENGIRFSWLEYSRK